MYATSELSTASMHGGIGNGYGVGYGIDMHDNINKQRQSKMTSNNDMDVDTNGTRRIAIKLKTPNDGLKDEVAKKAKYQSSTFQVVLQIERLMKSHLKMCGRKHANSMLIPVYEYANDHRHSNQAQRTESNNIGDKNMLSRK
ncbi:hypothetical protein RFI_36689, partial [Reticulomyxa filosa]